MRIGPTYRRRWLAALVVAALGASASAAPDPVEAYRRELRSIEVEARAYFELFSERLMRALAARQSVLASHPNATVGPVPEGANAEVQRLAEPLAALEARRGELARGLARSGEPRAGALLLAAAFEAVEDAETTDAEILGSRPTILGMIHEQAPAFLRQALAERETNLIAALVELPAAAHWLGTSAWEQATAKDGRRGVGRRVLVLDALARAASPESLPFLRVASHAELLCLRMAALEAAARCGPTAEPLLVDGLSDSQVLVRRAALDALRTLAPTSGRSLGAVLARLADARGAERSEALATLRRLSGQGFGDTSATWAAWLAKRQAEIDAGTFDAAREPKDESSTVVSDAPSAGFYGLPLSVDGVVFVIDWTLAMVFPADLALARTGKPIDWFGADPSWVGRDGQERQQTVVARELARALTTLGPAQRFGVVLLRDGSRDAWPKIQESSVLGRRELLAAGPRSITLLAKLFDAAPPGWSRWHEHMDGLWIAADLARLGPGPLTELGTSAADTLVLVSDGRHRGGRFLLPEAEVAAFARWNRFRRLVVHSVRIADAGPDAAALLEGFSRVSGGAALHVARAP